MNILFRVFHLAGRGEGITLGVEITKSDNIVIFGPDGNHEPKEILQLISKIQPFK